MLGDMFRRGAGLIADLIDSPHTSGRHIYNRLTGAVSRARQTGLRDVTRPFGWPGGGCVRTRRPPGGATTVWGGAGGGNVRRIPSAGEPVWAGTGGGRVRKMASKALQSAGEGELANNVTKSRKPIGVGLHRGMSMGTKLVIGGGAIGTLGLGTYAYDRHQSNKLLNTGYSRGYPRTYA